MNRITARFEQLRREARKGFIPFVTAGDPDIETSKEIVLTLAATGADVIELGVPFSDPMADGPTIQASSQRALENGVTLADVLKMVRTIRTAIETPIVVFSYLNPLICYGMERLAADAAKAGVDGVLVTDAVDGEAAGIAQTLRHEGLELISLIAPTTSDERLQAIADRSGGFLYAVSRAGVTGARADMTGDAEDLVRRARTYTDLPIAVGFGISTAEQISNVWRYADAAVVGSAIVAKAAAADRADAAAAVEQFVRGILPGFAKPGAEI